MILCAYYIKLHVINALEGMDLTHREILTQKSEWEVGLQCRK